MLKRAYCAVADLGETSLSCLLAIGHSGLFFCRSLKLPLLKRGAFSRVIEQLYSIGLLSFVIILFSSLFIGMVVALQGFTTLQKFAAEAQLGQLLALSITRELGPVVAALLFAGRAGSAITSEVGLMRATDQLSAMEMMAVNPLRHVIAPRLWSGIISLPLLTIFFDFFAIVGGYFAGVKWLGVDGGAFWNNMTLSVSFSNDVLNGLIKSLVFAILVLWVALYQGFYCAPNAQGISRATTKTVVYSSLLILGMDFILTSLMMGGW